MISSEQWCDFIVEETAEDNHPLNTACIEQTFNVLKAWDHSQQYLWYLVKKVGNIKYLHE